MENLALADFLRALASIENSIQQNKDYLCKLDSFIGDGDHGTTIARGFSRALKKVREEGPESISGLLKSIGFTLVSSMGGAAGPLFGSVFMGLADAAAGKDSIDLESLHAMFSASLEKVLKIGGAKAGDKTMIDALSPAVDSLKNSLEKGLGIEEAMANMSKAAKQGAASTKDMVARKGRSRYHGERSIGYQDAGATTMYLIIEAMHKSINRGEGNEEANK